MLKIPNGGGLAPTANCRRVCPQVVQLKGWYRFQCFRCVFLSRFHVPTVKRVRFVVRTARSKVRQGRHTVLRGTRRFLVWDVLKSAMVVVRSHLYYPAGVRYKNSVNAYPIRCLHCFVPVIRFLGVRLLCQYADSGRAIVPIFSRLIRINVGYFRILCQYVLQDITFGLRGEGFRLGQDI